MIGYDTESGAVQEASRRSLGILRRSIAAITKIHTELEAPATLFLVGKTLDSGARYIKPLLDFPDLFDFQQHTYSHVLLKTVVAENENPYARTERFVKGASLEVIRKEVRHTNQVLKRHLNVGCLGIRGPYGYYRGLSDRPDILEILHQEGIRFTSTYLRNEHDCNPVPMQIQPFWYGLQGFPDTLEIPAQGWQDCAWRSVYGWTKRKEFEDYLKSTLDDVRRKNFTWGICFHDWSVIKADADAGIVREFIRYAKERQVRIASYGEFYSEERRLQGGKHARIRRHRARKGNQCV